MRYWFKLFWAICLFKLQPKDVPRSVYLPGLLMLLALVLDTVTLSLSVPDAGFGTILLTVSVHLVVSLGSVALLMGLLGFASRINQTLSSLLGTGLIISLFAIVPLLMLGPMDQPPGIAALMLVALNIWDLMITAHILRHALSVNAFMGAILAIGLFMLSIWLMNSLLPEVG